MNFRSRKLVFESLDDRRMLAANVFHNAADPLDVNLDGQRTTADILDVVSDLLLNGSRELDSIGHDAPRPAIDVTNDGFATTEDALEIVVGLLAERSGPATAPPVTDVIADDLVERRLSVVFGEGETHAPSGTVVADYDALIDLIQSTIQPDMWDVVGGPGTIQFDSVSLSLVVRQTQQVQDEITDLLAQLRSLQTVSVTVETRFLVLSDNFFERIGVDFDFTIDDILANLPPNNGDPGVRVDIGESGIPTIQTTDFSEWSFQFQTPPGGADFGFAILTDIETFFLLEAGGQGSQPDNNGSSSGQQVAGDVTVQAPAPDDGSTNVQQPVFEHVSVTTTVSVPDGGTILLGGIKTIRRPAVQPGVPLLGQLTYVNRLFINNGVGHHAESLQLMVTPRIIIQEEEE